MQDNKDKIKNLRNYYDKLANILRNEGSFRMFGKAIYDKRRIDDAMCCIDANFPREFIAFKTRTKNLNGMVETFKTYNMLVGKIKNKPPIGSSSYMAFVDDALKLIEKLKFVAASDLNYIKENFPEL